jgi:hypothetical protein
MWDTDLHTLDNSSPEIFDDLHKEAVSPCFGIYHSQERYHSHLLWLKIFTPIVQTDVGEGHNTR